MSKFYSPEVEKLLGSFPTVVPETPRRNVVKDTKHHPLALQQHYNNTAFSHTEKIGLELFAEAGKTVELQNVSFERLYKDKPVDKSLLKKKYEIVCIHDLLPMFFPAKLPAILHLAFDCLYPDGIFLMSQSMKPEKTGKPYASFFFNLGLVKATNFFSNIYVQVKDNQNLILATDLEIIHD